MRGLQSEGPVTGVHNNCSNTLTPGVGSPAERHAAGGTRGSQQVSAGRAGWRVGGRLPVREPPCSPWPAAGPGCLTDET